VQYGYADERERIAVRPTPHRDALVCVPTYNERENLPSLVDELLATAPVDVLVVDDNSPDGTGRVADLIAEREPRVRVLHRPKKLGLGAAYLAGFRAGLADGYRFLLEMDADLSHQPRYVPELLRAAESADVVLGSRYVKNGGVERWGAVRRLLSRGGSLYARKVLGVDVKDLTGGFKCFRREVLEALDLGAVTTRGYAFQIELTYRALQLGFRVREIPIVFVERNDGRSKMTAGIVAEGVTAVWKMRFGDPSR
jgi:dolichol-phosphate mannosyltransferase